MVTALFFVIVTLSASRVPESTAHATRSEVSLNMAMGITLMVVLKAISASPGTEVFEANLNSCPLGKPADSWLLVLSTITQGKVSQLATVIPYAFVQSSTLGLEHAHASRLSSGRGCPLRGQ